MIEIPKDYKTAILTTSSPKSTIRFNTVSDEDKASDQIERRLAPTRRSPEQSASPIERRTSSDRRRPSFSSKA